MNWEDGEGVVGSGSEGDGGRMGRVIGSDSGRWGGM